MQDSDHAKKQARYTLCTHRPFFAKIRYEPREGTSALHNVYASFFKQRPAISHAKEQARCTLCIHRSLSKDPTKATRRNRPAVHCVFIVL